MSNNHSIMSPLSVYLSDCQSPVALQILTTHCQGKKSCLIRASTRDFGDPCYSGTRKYLSVIYTCGESQCTFTKGSCHWRVVFTHWSVWLQSCLWWFSSSLKKKKKKKKKLLDGLYFTLSGIISILKEWLMIDYCCCCCCLHTLCKKPYDMDLYTSSVFWPLNCIMAPPVEKLCLGYCY